MKLIPIRPPGPNARKARAFAAEIWQLRTQGYTFEAIREALAGAGVQVSNSTVQREVARAAKLPVPAGPVFVGGPTERPTPPSPAPVLIERPVTVQGASLPDDRLSGQEVAAAYTRNRITNPLIRSREKR